MNNISYPNESSEYRQARNELLREELELRAHIERVAQLRRRLPLGGQIKQDYLFDELVNGEVKQTKLSELFEAGKDTLALYSFMYAPNMDSPCPMCTALLDGLDGQVTHLNQQINFAVVAKHSLDKIHQHAERRGWSNFRLLSSANNSYNTDYFAEKDGGQLSITNVFVRNGDQIRHFWGSEMTLAPMIEGGNMRHLDLIWPLWNVLDMTPAGRGQWYPELSYG